MVLPFNVALYSGVSVAALVTSGSAPWTPADLGATLVTWLEADSAYLFQDSAGTTPVTSDTDPVGRVNAKAGSIPATQSTSSQRPLYRTGSLPYLQFDGSDDALSLALSVTSNRNLYCLLKTSDTRGMVATAAASLFVLAWDDGSGTSPSGGVSPTNVVDGTGGFTTRATLEDAISDNIWHVVEAREFSNASWSSTTLFNYGSGFQVTGELAALVVTVSSTETTTDRDNIRSYLQGLIP